MSKWSTVECICTGEKLIDCKSCLHLHFIFAVFALFILLLYFLLYIICIICIFYDDPGIDCITYEIKVYAYNNNDNNNNNDNINNNHQAINGVNHIKTSTYSLYRNTLLFTFSKINYKCNYKSQPL